MNGWEEFCRIDLESLVAPEIFDRGLRYFHDGHVLETFRIGPVLAGRVAGTAGNYKARLWFEDGMVLAECGCPFQGFCKHLTALALAWLESPRNFTDLEPDINRIRKNPETLEETFLKLCYYDPISFYHLSEIIGTRTFDSARGILNLVRNTFGLRQIRVKDAAALWENVDRILELLSVELRRGNLEGLLPLGELLDGLSRAYLEVPSEELTESYKKLAVLISELPSVFPTEFWRPFVETLLGFYFEPKFWEWHDASRDALFSLSRFEPELIVSYLDQRHLQDESVLALISMVELLQELSNEGRFLAGRLDEAEKELLKRSDGRLWLIDRYTPENPERAFNLARAGLRLENGEGKGALRDRMIQLHCRRCESKQAASLSFIQFREDPCFEEYLRLKEILRPHQQEWEKYYLRVINFLHETVNDPDMSLGLLLLKIYCDRGSYRELTEYLAQHPIEPEKLFDIVEAWDTDISWEAAAILPRIIEGLLAINNPGSWQKALKSAVIFKKACVWACCHAEWNAFRRRITDQYRDSRGFQRKFGAILSDIGDST